MGGSIVITPDWTTASSGFIVAFNAAIDRKVAEFPYGGTTFYISFDANGKPQSIEASLPTLDTPLPQVFRDGELQIYYIQLWCETPSNLLAQPGMYAGANFGYPAANCWIDPRGEHKAPPGIHANGSNLDQMRALLQRVLTGQLTPGRGNNAWDGSIEA